MNSNIELKISGNYSGCLMTLIFTISENSEENTTPRGIFLKLLGYLETNNTTKRIWSSNSLRDDMMSGYKFEPFNNNDCKFEIVLDRNMTPSFVSKHFKVKYKIEGILLGERTKKNFIADINIEGSNILDTVVVEKVFDLSEGEYQRKKKEICKALLNNHLSSQVTSLRLKSQVEEENKQKETSAALPVQFKPTVEKFFRPVPSIVRLSKERDIIEIKNDEEVVIAEITMPDVFINQVLNRIDFKLVSAIETVEVNIIEEYCENNNIIDIDVLLDKSFVTKNMLNFSVYFTPSNFTLKIDEVEIRHKLKISFDNSTASLFFKVGNSRALIVSQ